jgi:hypothetical protein
MVGINPLPFTTELINSTDFRIVGNSYRPVENRRLLNESEENTVCFLRPDPYNPFDSNAVKVYMLNTAGELKHIGFISKSMAYQLSIDSAFKHVFDDRRHRSSRNSIGNYIVAKVVRTYTASKPSNSASGAEYYAKIVGVCQDPREIFKRSEEIKKGRGIFDEPLSNFSEKTLGGSSKNSDSSFTRGSRKTRDYDFFRTDSQYCENYSQFEDDFADE